MPLILGGAAMASGVVGGIMGGKSAKKAAAAQQAAIAAAMEQAMSIINAVGAPPDLSKAIMIEQLQLAGVYTPEMEEAVNVEVSKVSQIQEDKALRDNQVRALQEISKRGRAGLTAEEKAEFNKSRGEVQRDLEAKNQQIIQNLAMRGQAGGGAEIASRLLASQESADRASEEADRINAAASARALEAIRESGQLSGQLRGQDFDIEATKAGAQDEFDRFNVENQIARQQRNTESRNVAQATNLGEKQRIQDTNTAAANQEKYRQVQAQRDFWSDKMRQAEAKASVLTGGAGMMGQAAGGQDNAAANMWGQIGAAGSSGFGALSNYYASKPKTGNTKVVNANQAGGDDDKYGNYA